MINYTLTSSIINYINTIQFNWLMRPNNIIYQLFRLFWIYFNLLINFYSSYTFNYRHILTSFSIKLLPPSIISVKSIAYLFRKALTFELKTFSFSQYHTMMRQLLSNRQALPRLIYFLRIYRRISPNLLKIILDKIGIKI